MQVDPAPLAVVIISSAVITTACCLFRARCGSRQTLRKWAFFPARVFVVACAFVSSVWMLVASLLPLATLVLFGEDVLIELPGSSLRIYDAGAASFVWLIALGMTAYGGIIIADLSMGEKQHPIAEACV